MQLIVLTTTGTFQTLDTNGTNNTGVLRDNAGGITAATFFGSVSNTAGTETINITTVTGATTLGNHGTVLADATSAAFTVTLPSAGANAGRKYTIKRINSGSNAVTVGVTGGDTIDGASTVVLSSQWSAVTVVSNGTEWYVTGSH